MSASFYFVVTQCDRDGMIGRHNPPNREESVFLSTFIQPPEEDRAVVLDQGVSPREFYQFYTIGCSAGVMPCFIDAEAHEEGTLFPLRCNRIQYEGKTNRIWGDC